MPTLKVTALECVEQQDSAFWGTDSVYLIYFSGKKGQSDFRLRAVASGAWQNLEVTSLRQHDIDDDDFQGDVNLLALVEKDSGQDMDASTVHDLRKASPGHGRSPVFRIATNSLADIASAMIKIIDKVLDGGFADDEGDNINALGNDEQIGPMKRLLVSRGNAKLTFNGNGENHDGGLYRLQFAVT